MIATLFALSLAQALPSAPTALDRLQQAQANIPPATTVVVLDCQVTAKSLTDCKAAGSPPDSGMVAEALRMAAGIVVPQALADSGAGRIKVKMSVSP